MSKIDKMLRRATPELQAICNGNQSVFNDIYNFSSETLDDMLMMYNTGKRHRQSAKEKLSYSAFLANHPELEIVDDPLLIESFTELSLALYSAYSDGYDGIKR